MLGRFARKYACGAPYAEVRIRRKIRFSECTAKNFCGTETYKVQRIRFYKEKSPFGGFYYNSMPLLNRFALSFSVTAEAVA